MKTFVRITLFLMLGFASTRPALPTAARSAPLDNFSQVDVYVTETMRRLPIKGLALAIVQGDQIVYQKGYGIANIDGDPVTPQTPFMLGSVTKTFTALAVQQLISEKKIGEFKPVQSYIPAFHLADNRGGADVNIHHLLEHTSGISTEEGIQPYLLINPHTTFSQALDHLARFRPKYKPGEHYEYSNWNYALLREVIAQASGQTYTSYMQEHILEPLDMSHASFADYHTLPHAATYDLNVFGFPVPYDEPYVPMAVGAGYLSASVEETAHYAIAFLNLGQYQDHVLLPAQRSGYYDTYWNWQAGDADGINIAISGSHNSTYASILLIPKSRLGVVVLMNTRLDEVIASAPTANDLTANIARLMLDAPYALPNFSSFYVAVILMDSLLLIFTASTVWQALHLKSWRWRYHAAQPARRIAAWTGIILDLMVCAGILALPLFFHANWNIMLNLRPDFSAPVLAIGVCLGAIGLFKIAQSEVILTMQDKRKFYEPNN